MARRAEWANAPGAALIKTLERGGDAVVLVFRQPDGTWSAEFRAVAAAGSLSEAMEAGEALLRRWDAGGC